MPGAGQGGRIPTCITMRQLLQHIPASKLPAVSPSRCNSHRGSVADPGGSKGGISPLSHVARDAKKGQHNNHRTYSRITLTC